MDVRGVLAALTDAGVEFAVIGGHALAAHGSSYATLDTDIVYSRSPENLRRLASALGTMKARLRVARNDEALPFTADERTLINGMNFTLTTNFGDLDLFGTVSGLGRFEEIKPMVESIDYHGQPVNVLSLRGLLISKRAAGRRKDLLVIPEIEALLEWEAAREHANGS